MRRRVILVVALAGQPVRAVLAPELGGAEIWPLLAALEQREARK